MLRLYEAYRKNSIVLWFVPFLPEIVDRNASTSEAGMERTCAAINGCRTHRLKFFGEGCGEPLF